MKLLCSLLLFIGTTAPLFAQSGFHQLDVTTSGNVAPGYLLIAPNGRDSLGLMDHYGKTVVKFASGIASNLQAYSNTHLTHFVAATPPAKSFFARRGVGLNIVDTMMLSGNYDADFHEGKVWSDSSYMILGIEKRTMNLSSLVAGGRTNAVVESAVIQERTFDGRLLFEWKSLDYIPVTDATEDVDLKAAYIDYIHVNSIAPTSDGHILISCRHLDEVIKINRQTGAVIWRLGGSKSRGNDFTFLNDKDQGFTGFSHQHSAWETPRGTILLFDNGNLKPGNYSSRAVEYEIDQSAYTAKKVWEHIPTQRTVSTSMGSVQELTNGNILIGYGTLKDGGTVGTLIAQEVTKNGQVVVNVKNTLTSNINTYRVLKSTFGMAGCYNVFTQPTTMDVTCDDRETNVSVTVTSVSTPTGVSVERHGYTPHNISFVNESYCGIIPMRWVVRVQDTTAITGSLRFDVTEVALVEEPDRVKLLYRPVEGQGAFINLEGTYDGQQQAFILSRIVSGEFMLAYKECFEPSPAQPLNASLEVSTPTKLSWNGAAINDGYDIEVSASPQFVSPWRATTFKLDTTLSNLAQAQTYYWRVRRIFRGTERGPWSEVFRFTTQLGIPTQISPVVSGDTIATTTRPVFRWKATSGSELYRLTVADATLEQPVVDVVTQADSFQITQPLMHNTGYVWYVRSIKGTITGRSSPKRFFITIPSTPELVSPANDTLLPHTRSLYFSWNAVPGATRYAVVLRTTNGNTVILRDTVRSTWVVLAEIPEKTDISWTVQPIGRYGAGGVSKTFHFTTYSTAPLQPPSTISPKNIDNIDAREDVLLRWSQPAEATMYRLQITASSHFDDVWLDTLTQVPSYTARGLQSGSTYSWRVMAKNEHVGSPWSDTARFMTLSAPGNALVPLWPRISAVDVPTKGMVSYSTSNEFIRYDVQISRSSSFEDIDFTFPSTTSTAEYALLRNRMKYYWRVVGVRSNDSATVGPHSTFTTEFETVSVNGEPQSGGVVFTALEGGILVASTTQKDMTCRVVNTLGQLLASGNIGANATTLLQMEARGPVFVEVFDQRTNAHIAIYPLILR